MEQCRRRLLFRLSRLELFETGMQKNVVLLLAVGKLVSLRPIVRHSIGKYLPTGVETTPRDRIVHLFRRLQLGASVLVPEREFAVAPNSRKGAMNWMECDIIYRVDVLESIGVRRVRTMTFEGEVVLGIARLNVLDCDAALYGA